MGRRPSGQARAKRHRPQSETRGNAQRSSPNMRCGGDGIGTYISSAVFAIGACAAGSWEIQGVGVAVELRRDGLEMAG